MHFLDIITFMIELTSKQRKGLEKLAHSLQPLVIVGQAGLTESLEKQVSEFLNERELVKVKFNEFHEEKRELGEQLAKDTNSTLVRIIGFVAILFKESDNPEKRKIFIEKLK